jgi:hypothetical protein
MAIRHPTPPRAAFILLDDPPPIAPPVAALIDGRVTVLQLARGLALAGLQLRHDADRDVLVIEVAP